MSAAPPQAPEFLAAGTDLLERLRSGVSRAPVSALQFSDDDATIIWEANGSARIGAGVTIAAIAADHRLAVAYPGLAAAAGHLATPQIRNVATLGGNLAQRTRCWYFRNPHTACLKKGGDSCPARSGNHLYGVIFDPGACVAVHPSTMGAALLAYDAAVVTSLRASVSVTALLGDGSDGARDNWLGNGEMIRSILLPPPVEGERAIYDRVIGRAHAEWPLVEAVVRLVRDGETVRFARVAVGGVAPVPMRLFAVERAVTGQPLDDATAASAARHAIEGAKPLPLSVYKIVLLENLVRDLIARMAAA